MPRSTVSPDKFWIRKVENGHAHIKLRDNIITVQDEETETEMYQYDETEVVIVDRPNLEDYVNKNFNLLFEMGMTPRYKEPDEKERIDALEEAVLEMILNG